MKVNPFVHVKNRRAHGAGATVSGFCSTNALMSVTAITAKCSSMRWYPVQFNVSVNSEGSCHDKYSEAE